MRNHTHISECPNGYYGPDCIQSCSQHHCKMDTVCDRSNGIINCQGGCQPGYTGDTCKEGNNMYIFIIFIKL